MVEINLNYLNEIIWKKVLWYTGETTNYSISSTGVVRNDITGKILKTNFSKGYERLNLNHNGKFKQYLVHRLVATAFIPNPDNKPEVNHINGVKSCNHVFNLEWVDRVENQRHSIQFGLANKKKTNRKKLTYDQVVDVCKLLEENVCSQVEIARIIGCSRQVIGRILRHQAYTDITKDYNIDKYTVKTYFGRWNEDNTSSKYTTAQIKEVCEMIDSANISLREISFKTKVHYQTVRNIYYGTCHKDISKDYSFMKNKKYPLYEKKKSQVIAICELLDKGLKVKDISQELNLPKQYIRDVKYGIIWKSISKEYNFMKKYLSKK